MVPKYGVFQKFQVYSETPGELAHLFNNIQ